MVDCIWYIWNPAECRKAETFKHDITQNEREKVRKDSICSTYLLIPVLQTDAEEIRHCEKLVMSSV